MELWCDHAWGSFAFAPAVLRLWFRSRRYAVFPRCCSPAGIAAVVCNWAVKGADPFPKRFYAFFTLTVLITASFYFAELFTSTPLESIYFPFVECTLAVIALLILAFEPRNAKVKYGLSFSAGKSSINGGVIALFILLYFVRLIPGYADLAYTEAFAAQLDQKTLYLLYLPFLFFWHICRFWGRNMAGDIACSHYRKRSLDIGSAR